MLEREKNEQEEGKEKKFKVYVLYFFLTKYKV